MPLQQATGYLPQDRMHGIRKGLPKPNPPALLENTSPLTIQNLFCLLVFEAGLYTVLYKRFCFAFVVPLHTL